jgi:membrane protein
VAADTARSSILRAPSYPEVRAVVMFLIRDTVATCFRYRVTGLAAEAGFFALLSLPPLVLGLVGTLGYLDGVIGPETVQQIRNDIVAVARTALATDVVQQVIVPTLDRVLGGGRFDIVSVAFLISLWSGSRALNVYVDTISIMADQGGHRGIVRTRALSFSLYLIALVLGIVVAPLVVIGPDVVSRLLPENLSFVNALYWPVVVVVTAIFLATLYHVSVPVRGALWRELPGAVLALLGWLLGSYLLRQVLKVSVGGPSIYGPLASPIVVLLWLYVLSLAVLIGAALNAAVDRRWPARGLRAEPGRHAHAGGRPLTPLPDGDPTKTR